MAVMKKYNAMKRGDKDFQYADNIVAVKWYDNCGVTLVRTCLEGCNQISFVSRRVKDKHEKYLTNTCVLSFICKEIQ